MAKTDTSIPRLPEALREVLKTYVHPEDKLAKAEEERKQALSQYPLEGWPDLALERFALGQGTHDTYCYLLEYGAPHLGSIRGGAAHKMIIYKHREEGWHFPPEFRTVEEAWEAVRSGFVAAFDKAAVGDWESIEEIEALSTGRALLLKSLHIYFPDDVMPINSMEHLRHYLDLLGVGRAEYSGLGAVQRNRLLLSTVRSLDDFDEWTNQQIAHFLYQTADARTARKLYKIAPGRNARFWSECLAGGFICVGWEGMGDLREFSSFEEYMEAYNQAFSDTTQSARTKKAKELWTLKNLEPGDLVAANRGTSEILAVGTVREPGYEWLGERPEYKHIVRVDWDTDYAKTIPQQPGWAFATLQKVQGELKATILSKGGRPLTSAVRDPLFEQVATALERKGQVILYGPPGTGKTYVARRFAVWSLLAEDGEEEADATLADPERFAQRERELSAAQVTRRTWWVVANRTEWSWDQIFEDGTVNYRYGRLKRNYPLIQPGDLVIGYQTTPERQVKALAQIKQGLSMMDGEQRIVLSGVAPIVDGLSYEELRQDPILMSSEPMRFRNQGTLFALSQEEADHLFALLTERDPSLAEHIGAEQGIGRLTRITFHPSYSYEDFIEGFRPVAGAGDGVTLRMTDGVFKQVCLEAQARPNERFLILVDEINRANVAKVFGEIITLLEKDKRDLVVTLPQSKDPFAIPPNVYLLGTMNTADRSIKLLDVALRRRFAFIELMPDPSLFYGARVGGLALDDFLAGLNERIAAQEGREKQIGHSLLLQDGAPITDPAEFAEAFRHEILPLLQEYCYEDYSTLARYIGSGLVDAEKKILRTDVLEDPESLVEALEREFRAREEPVGPEG